MKRKTSFVLSLILTLAVLIGACTPKTVPEGFDKAQVVARAKEVISLLSAKDYQGVTALFHPVMAKFDAKALEAAVGAQLDGLGALQSQGEAVLSAGKEESIGAFAIVVIPCEYAKGRATYTISVDGEGRICGLYMR